jgi:hypothetical protein
MEFLRLLEIDRSLVTREAQKSLLLADRVWNEEGCPQEACALCGVLEKILRRCLDSNIWYAPVLLQRRKALERGSWRPRATVPTPVRGATSAPAESHGEPPSSTETCAECGGTGIVIRAGGFSGSLCSCGRFLSRIKRSS